VKLGFNIAIVCIVTSLCITSLLIVAVANGHDGAMITGGCATLIGIPTYLVTKFVYKKQSSNKQ